jgi:alpha-beta hydrolase superfamily lysophospholipase
MWRIIAYVAALLVIVGSIVAATHLPSVAAGALLHPMRTPLYKPTPVGCVDQSFAGEGIRLRGWHCPALTPRQGSLIYLHGIADNRASAAGVIPRYTKEGLDVVAYDSRGHGVSGGERCTYGHFEKLDLRRVIDSLAPGPVILIGTSLGAAVALQAAVGYPRVAGIVAAEAFSDLETIARERAPGFLPGWVLRHALRLAEEQGDFTIEDVSPVKAAAQLHMPVLLIHGAEDLDTVPDHSRRLFTVLAGPKQLIIVPRARHNQSLSDPAVWTEIDAWIKDVLRTKHAAG